MSPLVTMWSIEMKYDYCVVILCSLLVTMIPQCQSTPVECFVILGMVRIDMLLSGSEILRKLVYEGVVGWSCFLCLLWWAACDPMVIFQSTRGLSSIMNSNQLCRYNFSACGATVKMVDFIMIFHSIVGSINISKISFPSISFRLQSFIPMITLCEA